MYIDEIKFSTVYTETFEQIALKKLYIGVLERAVRDLASPIQHIRREAYEWFSEWEDGLPKKISYKDVAECLNLNISQIAFIQKKIHSSSLEQIVFSSHGCKHG